MRKSRRGAFDLGAAQRASSDTKVAHDGVGLFPSGLTYG